MIWRQSILKYNSHDTVNLKGNTTFSSCSYWNNFPKRFSGCTKESATEDQTLNHNLVNISFFNMNEFGLVGITLPEYIWVAIHNFASQKSSGQ